MNGVRKGNSENGRRRKERLETQRKMDENNRSSGAITGKAVYNQ